MSSKVAEYYRRGRRALSEREIADVLSRLPRVLRMPKYVYVLDGVIEVNGVAVGAYRVGRNYLILTPLSDQETVVHETLHVNGLGELLTYALSPRLYRFIMSLPARRKVMLVEEEVTDEDIARLGVAPTDLLPPGIRKYRIIELM